MVVCAASYCGLETDHLVNRLIYGFGIVKAGVIFDQATILVLSLYWCSKLEETP